MASSSIAKQNLNAVIASQIRCLDDHDRLKQSTLFTTDDAFDDKANDFHNISRSPLSHLMPMPSSSSKSSNQSSHDYNFDNNNNSLPDGLTPSIFSVCQSQILSVGNSPLHLISTPIQLQRISRSQTTKRSRNSDFASESQTSSLSDASSSSSPSCKRKKSPSQTECYSGAAVLFPISSSSSTTPIKHQKNQILLPASTGASSIISMTLPYETTVTGKKKGTKGSLGATGARRNERERNRVKQVNMGFDKLREHVPQGRQNKKLSKVDTLKAAVGYIEQLQQILGLTEEFLTNSQNFTTDLIISDKIIDDENADEDSDNDSESFKNMNGNDYNDGLTVLANASCLAEKENMFENSLFPKQIIGTEFRSQTNMTDPYYVQTQVNIMSNESFMFHGNSLSNDSPKISSNEFQLEELLSSLSSQQQNELLMGALKVDSNQEIQNNGVLRGDAQGNFTNTALGNFMEYPHKSFSNETLVTSFQPNLDQLMNNNHSNEKLGSLLEALMNENVEDLLLDFRPNDDNHHLRQHVNPRR